MDKRVTDAIFSALKKSGVPVVSVRVITTGMWDTQTLRVETSREVHTLKLQPTWHVPKIAEEVRAFNSSLAALYNVWVPDYQI